MRLELGDCLEVLKTIPDNSIDSIVTDPPYHLTSIVKRFGKEGSAPAQYGTDGAFSRASKGFMGKTWDGGDIAQRPDVWIECLRVLKPGGHMVAFSGSRTYHRMAVAIEDAGFDIRDQIMWIYGSGFPKSHNIGKAVDKLMGNEREVVGIKKSYVDFKDEQFIKQGSMMMSEDADRKDLPITKGNTEWEGWGTALKPAHEPIVVARKPLSEKSVAENVLKWGTGGMNIDVSRVGTEQIKSNGYYNQDNVVSVPMNNIKKTKEQFEGDIHTGRWPANIILDEEAGQVLDEQSGISKSAPTKEHIYNKNVVGDDRTPKAAGIYGAGSLKMGSNHNDKGGASRFFYCPKTSKKDRDEGLDGFNNKTGAEITGRKEGSAGLVMEDDKQNPYAGKASPINKNNHPTVKPTSLMEYLIKLVTPVNGTVLDPFMGSGSTGKASVRNGFDFIGIEREEEYIKIAEARIKNELNG